MKVSHHPTRVIVTGQQHREGLKDAVGDVSLLIIRSTAAFAPLRSQKQKSTALLTLNVSTCS